MNEGNVMTMQWRRLDVPGHDACRLARRDGAWHLEGTASFVHAGGAALLGYRAVCDDGWRTQHGSVRGRVGARAVSIDIVRTPQGHWLLNGARNLGVDACLDLDFGFTPATNLTQLKRCALAIGAAADVPVAWFDVDVAGLQLMPQRYERRSEVSYWYESPPPRTEHCSSSRRTASSRATRGCGRPRPDATRLRRGQGHTLVSLPLMLLAPSRSA